MTEDQRQIIALNRRVGLLEGSLWAWVNYRPLDEAERDHMVAASKRILEEIPHD
jgi:hypothetical protein